MSLPCSAAIVGAYGLERFSVVEQFESYGNESWLIADGGRRYVLRRHRLNADIRRIEFQLALQRHLTECGIPTSVVVETASRGGSAIDDDGVPWVLFSYVAGQEYDFASSQQVMKSARTLAQFHLMTESFHWPTPGPEYKVPLRQCWANVEQDLVELAEMLNGDTAEDDLRDLSDWWKHVLAELPAERLAALPSGWMHGDFHGRNLVFDERDHVIGLFDFDDVDRGPYAYDVAAGVLKLARESRRSLRVRPDVARAFVDGYATVRTISEEERAALPLLVVMAYPPNPRNYRYWRDRYSRDGRGELVEHRFHREMTSIRMLRKQLELIGGALS